MIIRSLSIAALVLALGCGDSETTSAPSPPSTVDTIGSWPTGNPADHGYDAAALDAAGDALSEPSTRSLLVIQDGEIILERYWDGHGPDEPFPVFSVTKSFASTLVGVAEQLGYLHREDLAAQYIPQWADTGSASLTVRHLMTGDSGRTWDFAGDYPGSLGGGVAPADLTTYAIDRGQQFTPGTTWQYNQMAIQCLERVLNVATGQSTESFAREQLFEPLGLSNTRASTDETGQMTLAYGIESSARDLARFGWLYLQEGRWNGTQVLSRAFVRAATSTANPVNQNYGYLFWLNADRDWYEPVTLRYHETGKVYPSAPDDIFVASGFAGQLVLVSPSERLIIVRQGAATTPGFAQHYDDIYRTISEARKAS